MKCLQVVDTLRKCGGDVGDSKCELLQSVDEMGEGGTLRL